MKRTVGYLGVIAALAGTVFLTGCPATSSGLFVYPTAINFGETRTSETLTISNGGGVTAWTASVAYTEGAGWLSVDPAGGSATVNATTVHLRATRTGLSTGVYHATVTISAGGGNAPDPRGHERAGQRAVGRLPHHTELHGRPQHGQLHHSE